MDPDFIWYADRNEKGFADDDLLGFMSAEAAKEEVEASGESADEELAEDEPESAESQKRGAKKKATPKKKGTANVRRAVLEVTRAISLTPWTGDVTFNAASPGATPSAQKKGSNPVPYGTEVHATRYQYGIALTPERLRDPARAAHAIEALCSLGTVAGNHGRFLFDFAPDAVVFRITSDPAPRLLYCFDTPDAGRTVIAPRLAARVAAEDIDPKELIIAGLDVPGVTPSRGVKAACDEAVRRIDAALKAAR
jgi:CRISPR-associated protein Cst2